MFKNLDAEQARRDLTNAEVTEKLGISRISYASENPTGTHTVDEV